MIDEKDLRILTFLRQNSKLTNEELSKRISMPITTVHNRVKRLERLGVIKSYT